MIFVAGIRGMWISYLKTGPRIIKRIRIFRKILKVTAQQAMDVMKIPKGECAELLLK